MEKAMVWLAGAMILLLGALQLAVVLPLYIAARIDRLRHLSPKPPPMTGPVEPAKLLRLSAALPGLAPSTLGSIAVAQVRLGQEAEGRATLATAEARFRRVSAVPRWLRWDDSFLPEFERRSLDAAGRGIAEAAGGHARRAAAPEPVALTWLRLVTPSAGPVERLVAEGRFAEAADAAERIPRDPVAAMPAAAMALVAEAMHKSGDDPGAAVLLRRAVDVARRFSNIWPPGDDGGYRERTLASLCVLQSRVGDEAGAAATLHLIRDQDSADRAEHDLSLLAAARDDLDGALHHLWRIADREKRARASLDVLAARPGDRMG